MSNNIKDFDHYDLLFPSRYLKAGDLKGKEVTVVIRKIEPRHELKGEKGRSDSKPVVYLSTTKGRELDKMWVLNRTNAKRIVAMYGPKATDWIGKAVVLRAEKEPRSDTGYAVRVKEGAKPPAPKHAGPLPDPDDFADVGPAPMTDEEIAEAME